MKFAYSFLAVLFSIVSVGAQTPAFPGSEGGGKYATGGRGGKVLYVTSLADDGSVGTFRWAVSQKGARTVLFKVSGIINLQRQLSIKNGDLTIAGQSAPGDGICFKDNDISIGASNVIVRFIRFRLGDLVKEHEPDAFGGRNNKNVIIDHCSASWSVDEVASFYSNENFTLQWSIIAEALNNSEHPKGAHGYGGIWGGKNATFHHNLIAHNNSRNPRLNGFRRAGLKYGNSLDDEIVDFRNNVLYNWGENSVYGGESGKYNIVGNYYKSGPATPKKLQTRITKIDIDADPTKCPPGFGTYYIADNVVNGFPEVTKENWKGVVLAEGVDAKVCKAVVPFKTTPIATQSVIDAYDHVLSYSGASLKRDAVDSRIVNETRTGTATFKGSISGKAGLIDTQSDVGSWPTYTSGKAPIDNNQDGIPDEWLAKNFPGKSATDTNKEGYTLLEVYLNGLVNHLFPKQK